MTIPITVNQGDSGGLDLLWADPIIVNNAFSSQKIDLDLSLYRAILIGVYDDVRTHWRLFTKINGEQLMYGNIATNSFRSVTISDTGIDFSVAYTGIDEQTMRPDPSSYVQPLYIYGIR